MHCVLVIDRVRRQKSWSWAQLRFNVGFENAGVWDDDTDTDIDDVSNFNDVSNDTDVDLWSTTKTLAFFFSPEESLGSLKMVAFVVVIVFLALNSSSFL